MTNETLTLTVHIHPLGGVLLSLDDKAASSEHGTNEGGTTMEKLGGTLSDLGLEELARQMSRTTWPNEGVKTVHVELPATSKVMQALGFRR